MDYPCRILLHLHPRYADCSSADFAAPLGCHGHLVLGYLEVLAHVRVEVALPREEHFLRERAVQREANLYRRIHCRGVQNRLAAGHAKAILTREGVRLLLVPVRASAEHLRLRPQLHVNLKPDFHRNTLYAITFPMLLP